MEKNASQNKWKWCTALLNAVTKLLPLVKIWFVLPVIKNSRWAIVLYKLLISLAQIWAGSCRDHNWLNTYCWFLRLNYFFFPLTYPREYALLIWMWAEVLKRKNTGMTDTAVYWGYRVDIQFSSFLKYHRLALFTAVKYLK